MAKVTVNSVLRSLSGTIDQTVFKRYADKIVATRKPDMSKVIPSPAQQAHRARFRAAARYADAVLADPKAKAEYAAEAGRRRLSVRALAIADYFAAPVISLVAADPSAVGSIEVRTGDDFEVVRMRVDFADASGSVLEQGEAHAGVAGAWYYRTTRPEGPPSAVRQVTITATDRPGNRTVVTLDWPGLRPQS